jgi:hypothetical protein
MKFDKELKDLLKLVNKNLIASARRERLLIRSTTFLKKIVTKLGLEDDELKNLIKEVGEKLLTAKQVENFLFREFKKLKYIYQAAQISIDSSEALLKKLDAQQIWFFENIDSYVEKQVESKLNNLSTEKTNE